MRNSIDAFQPKMGEGVPGRIGGLPPHNPEPRTPRGKRRHDQRNADEKKKAEAAWGRARSTNESRYQKALRLIRPSR